MNKKEIDILKTIIFHDASLKNFQLYYNKKKLELSLILDNVDDGKLYSIKYKKIISYDFNFSNSGQFYPEVNFAKFQDYGKNIYQHKILLHCKGKISIKCKEINIKINK